MGQRGKRDDRLVIPLVWHAVNGPRAVLAGLAIMGALWESVLPDTFVAHRLLVPALGLIVGVRAWWPPAEAPPAPAEPPAPAKPQSTPGDPPALPAPAKPVRPRPARPVRPQAAIGKPVAAAA